LFDDDTAEGPADEIIEAPVPPAADDPPAQG
jgi:hypothetical protein